VKEELESELELLENAEEIKLKLSASNHLLDEAEISILQQLQELKSQLMAIESFSDSLREISDRVDSCTIELQDLQREISQQQDMVEYQPDRIAAIKEQLDQINRLEKKHNVVAIEDLIRIRGELSASLHVLSNLDESIEKALIDFNAAFQLVKEKGAVLSESRKLAALNLSDEIEKLIRQLGIENGIIEIKILEKEPSPNGLDTVEILFSANKGIAPKELKEVASGGEFSRLIFAVKYLIADKTALPTIIFDEIDTGVSGQIALQMIRMMKAMAKNHQVISISHLPQFAAGGDAHYFVYKDHQSERSVSKMKKLEGDQRIQSIAEMIGGSNPKEAAIDSAKELLEIG
ncbi:MAG: DNA repair protein RecN, partial [Bacteroidota bacterium]